MFLGYVHYQYAFLSKNERQERLSILLNTVDFINATMMKLDKKITKNDMYCVI